MSKKPRDNRPYLPKVTRIELSEQSTKTRMILILIFLAIAAVAFAWGISAGLSTEAGWQVVKAAPKNPNYQDDFILRYDFSGEDNATALEKKLVAVYTEANEQAFRVYSADVAQESVQGLWYLNAHPNERVTVDKDLYEALSLVVQYENRHLFTAPAAGSYDSLFLSEHDAEAQGMDPELDPDTLAWLTELAEYVNSPEHIRLELHGQNQVTLHVSEAYGAFARENGLETLADFGWMRNAFVIDDLADALIASGLTNGYLSSYDGFTRNLDQRGTEYTQNLFDRQERDILMPGFLRYSKPLAIVFLRDYPMADNDRWHYYAYDAGRIVTTFLDPADCLSGSSTDSLYSWSESQSCGELLMQMAPVFTAETFDSTKLPEQSLWFEEHTAVCTDRNAQINLLADQGEYTLQVIQ